MLGATVALAEPIKVDNRPPLKAQQAVGFTQSSANPVINITINSQGQNPQDLAKEIERAVNQALRKAELDRQAKQRSNYAYRG